MREILRPARLRPGARIGVAAISGAIDPSRLDRGIAYLKERGYQVTEAENLRQRAGDFAGTDRERAEGYRGLVRDEAVEAIIFARGGWGAMRTFGELDPDEIARHPKIHMGGSDLTALFAYLESHCGLVSFLGPMVAVDFARNPVDPETGGSWEPALRGDAPRRFPIGAHEIVARGRGRGRLTGGCLTLLVSLEATPEAVATDGRIVFWEDVNEEVYRLDRMLTQWKRAGRFDSVSGVIIGALEQITRNGGPDERALDEMIRDHFSGAKFPVIRDWPAGHGRRNRVMPLGAEVSIDANSGSVTIEESGVA